MLNTNALLSASFVHFQFSGISIVFTYCVPVVSTFESLFVAWKSRSGAKMTTL